MYIALLVRLYKLFIKYKFENENENRNFSSVFFSFSSVFFFSLRKFIENLNSHYSRFTDVTQCMYLSF